MRSLVLVILLAGSAHADCKQEAHRARRWNYTWAAIFGTASAVQLGLAIGDVGNTDYHETLYVGAAKAGIGFAARIVLPLNIDCDAPLGDAAKRERANFWLGHAGAFAVNLAGAIVLAERRSLVVGLESFAIGYPVGLLSIYTAPRAAWHLAVTPTGVGVAGEW